MDYRALLLLFGLRRMVNPEVLKAFFKSNTIVYFLFVILFAI